MQRSEVIGNLTSYRPGRFCHALLMSQSCQEHPMGKRGECKERFYSRVTRAACRCVLIVFGFDFLGSVEVGSFLPVSIMSSNQVEFLLDLAKPRRVTCEVFKQARCICCFHSGSIRVIALGHKSKYRYTLAHAFRYLSRVRC